MSNLEQEKVLLETQDWWSNVQERENEDYHMDEGMGVKHPINKPRQLRVTLIHTNTVPSNQEHSLSTTVGGLGVRHPTKRPNSMPQQQQHQVWWGAETNLNKYITNINKTAIGCLKASVLNFFSK
jgi:hypothetical protein